MKVIVTGANGFIGKMLIKELLSRGYDIIAIDIIFNDPLFNNPRIICINIQGKTIASLEDALKKYACLCLFHLAWAGTSGPNRSDFNIQLENVSNTCHYIELCKRINCRRVIYASSINEMETYEYLQSDNISPTGGYIYGTAKLAAHLMGETMAKINGIDFIPVIITNIYGVGEKSARMIYSSIKKLINNEHCSFTQGYQMYDFIYITDAINSIVEVSEKGKPFNRYYIGSGHPQPLRNFLIEMKNIVNPNAEIGLGDLDFNGINISYNQFDLKKVERDTGYKNKVPFSIGIKMTMDYIKNGEKK